MASPKYFSDWRAWTQHWKKPIIDQSPYEWEFVNEVLRRVPGLDPNCVFPQHEFRANDGRIRHMDFGIIQNGVRIAIELEGWDKTGNKTGKSRQEHDEFNRRLQSLSMMGWTTMPITNAQFKDNPNFYVSQLHLIISGQVTRDARQPAGESGDMETVDKHPADPRGAGKRRRIVTLTLALLLAVTSGLAIFLLGKSEPAKPSDISVPANPGNTVDCERDFIWQEDAQAWFERYFKHYGDVARLDVDGDGRACESLPQRP